jgi:hypothetical protein
VFLPDGTNEARLVDQVDATISKVVDSGFSAPAQAANGQHRIKGHFEVRRILKAFVDAQWLAEFDARLEVYRTALSDAASAAITRPCGAGWNLKPESQAMNEARHWRWISWRRDPRRISAATDWRC